MVFSYLKFGFNIGAHDIQVYEDDGGLDIEEVEDRIHTLREEALRLAPLLREIYALFRKGATMMK